MQRGGLPGDLVIGRWWSTSGAPCEVDVLGLRGNQTVLLGEAKWQAISLGMAELEALRRKTAATPHPVATPIYALWGRAGVTGEVRRAGAVGFDAKNIVDL